MLLAVGLGTDAVPYEISLSRLRCKDGVLSMPMSTAQQNKEVKNGEAAAIGGVVVNYHSDEETREVAETISRSCTEVVIVDNSAPSPILSEWAANRTGRKYIDSGGNVGYAAANNIGLIALSESCNYYFITNPDVNISEPKILEKLAHHLREIPDLGIVAPAIGMAPQSNQHGNTITVHLLHQLNQLPPIEPLNRNLIPRTQVVGCAMMISADIIDDIGPLDSEFFLYNEEIEFCYRAREEGYHVAYDPECTVEHDNYEGISHPNPYQIYYRTRNIFTLARRRFTGLTKLLYISTVFVILYSVVINIRFDLILPWLKGFVDGLQGIEGKSRYVEDR